MVPSFREKGKRRKDTGSRSGANLKGAVMSLKTLSVPKQLEILFYQDRLTSNCCISKPPEAVSQ